MFFGGHGVPKQKISGILEHYQILNFENFKIKKSYPVYCGHDDMILAALFSVIWRCKTPKIVLQRDLAKVPEAISQDPLI